MPRLYQAPQPFPVPSGVLCGHAFRVNYRYRLPTASLPRLG
jgi:hypothetical protein